ncbi:MAG: DUF898 domain-containing protein [Boseongicola sp.]|nr:DUF898 domain-containing protein [Boseongicola sp.]NNJ68410.1 DUF898 family protein [Boseongicola sp.]
MAMGMGILSVLTLGFYRFWMKTRLRRYYWSSIKPGGHPLEYVGDPLEKLLGFFIAVVILAFYIGIVNLILMFVSFSLFDGNTAAYIASFVGVIPLWFYARYRARRYVLARTRWRGIRFGVDPGAWGYAWRALVYWALALGSGTLLWPLMTHRLEKFRIDRTWYGDRQLHQGGSARDLVKGMVPIWLTLIVIGLVVGNAYNLEDVEAALGTLLLAVPVLAISWGWYSVRSFRVLAATKTAGTIGFRSAARAPRVIGIYLFGYGLASILTGIAAIAASLLFAALLFASNDAQFSLDDLDNLSAPGLALQAVGFAIYFLVFVIWAALRHILVTLPIWRHYAETLEITGAQSLLGIQQRDRDEHREAEGFAEALDLGAAI